MKFFGWDDAKNAKIRADRGIGFEEIVFHIERGDLLDILEHPNPDRYAGQRVLGVQRSTACSSSRLSRTRTRFS